MNIDKKQLLLYAVTDRAWLGGRTLAEQVSDAIDGGATIVQLREKSMPRDELVAEAREICALCHSRGIPFIINDDAELARLVGADGVHVGLDDLDIAAAREIIGEKGIIGASAHSVEEALAAERAGADYLGVGAVFGSSTKTNARPLALETLRDITAAVSIPVVAIGGVTRSNLPRLADSGIAGAALVSAIFAAADIKAECRALREMLIDIVD